MKKYLFAGLLIAALCVSALTAKSQQADSLVEIAQSDAKKFRLNKADMKKFRKDKRNSNSDFFKPAKNSVSDTILLTDSVYVKAYRMAAYKKTRKRRTAWHGVWIGAIADAAVGIGVMAVYISSKYPL